jgi:hypothetical protein
LQATVLHSQWKIPAELINYFHDILLKPEPDRRDAIRKITQNIPHLVNEDQNAALL